MFGGLWTIHGKQPAILPRDGSTGCLTHPESKTAACRKHPAG